MTVAASIGVKANDKAGTGVTLGNVALVTPWTPAGSTAVCNPICKLQGTYSNVQSSSVSLNADGSFSANLPNGASAGVYFFKYQLAGTDAASNPLTPVTAIVRIDAYSTNTANFVSAEDVSGSSFG